MTHITGAYTVSVHKTFDRLKPDHLDLFFLIQGNTFLYHYYIDLAQFKNRHNLWLRGRHHRLKYLNYNGSISGNRGRVKIIAKGTFLDSGNLLKKDSECIKTGCRKGQNPDLIITMHSKINRPVQLNDIEVFQIIPNDLITENTNGLQSRSLRQRALSAEEKIITKKELNAIKEEVRVLKQENERLRLEKNNQNTDIKPEDAPQGNIQYKEFTEKILLENGQAGPAYHV